MKLTRRKVLLGLGVLFALLVLLMLEERWRGQWALHRWKTRLTAQGEKFGLEPLLPPFTDAADNAFLGVNSAAGAVRGNPDLGRILPPGLRFAAPGKVIVISRQTNWEGTVTVTSYRTNAQGVAESSGSRQVTTNIDWAVLAAELAPFTNALDEARSALEKPGFNANLDYRMGFEMRLPHLAQLKLLAQVLAGSALNHLHDGQVEAAAQDLGALLALVHAPNDERLVISQLVRQAMAYIAAGATWQALQTPGWTDAPLAGLQRGWERQEFAASLARSTEMERAVGAMTYDRCRRSGRYAVDALGLWDNSSSSTVMNVDELMQLAADHFPEFATRAFYVPLWQITWSHQDELRYAQALQQIIGSLRGLAEAREGWRPPALRAAPESDEWALRARENWSGWERFRFPFATHVGLALDNTFGRAQKAQTLRELTVAAIALKRYELRHGQPPPALGALVPEFLRAVPRDFFDGQPLRYRTNGAGHFTLYSVSTDARDDGGDASSSAGPTRNVHWWSGKDLVWPAPATAEELAADEAKRARRK